MLKKYIFLFIEIFLFPFIFIQSLIFILLNFRIFKSKIIYPNFTWSFGHQILSLDWVSRIYFPNKILMLEFLHNRNNKYLADCYENIEVLSIYHKKYYPFLINRIRYKCFIFILVIGKFFYDYEIIKYSEVYNKFSSRLSTNFKYYNEITNKIENYGDISGYRRLLEQNIGLPPKIPANLEAAISKKLKELYPHLSLSKSVTLQLRKNRGNTFYDKERVAISENYVEAVRYLVDLGYTVFLLGDVNEDVFLGISGVYNVKIDCFDKKLVDLYLLFNSKLFITQHSGPIMLANSLKVPVIVCDSFPFYIGTFNSNDIILFKNVSYNGRILNLNEIIEKYPEVIYGYGFFEGKFKLIANSSEQILYAIKKSNLQKVKFPDDVLISTQNNFICIF